MILIIFNISFKIYKTLKLNKIHNFRKSYLIFEKNKLVNNISIEEIYGLLPKINLNNDENIYNLNDIFDSRELFIKDSNITKEYIHLLRPIDEKNEKRYNQKLYENIEINETYNNSRPELYSFGNFYNLCKEGIFLNYNLIQYYNKPLISIIVPSFNKENVIRKSILSIQNQSLKNIEIIIIDDCSTDNSKNIYKYLLKVDPRIKIIYHLKNMGIWRTRIDGFLYSKGKYIIQFDMEDSYTDNYILEDAYNLIERYNLDSLRFSFIKSEDSNNPFNKTERIIFSKEYTKIIYGTRDFEITTWEFGTVWNRLVRANVLTKGLSLVDNYILNAYKNLWDDRWYNELINKNCFSYLLINRIGYLYLPNMKGERFIKIQNNVEKDTTIKEFIYFWLFDLELLPKENNKKKIINILNEFSLNNNTYMGVYINLSYLNCKFEIYEHLLNSLINDPFVLKEDKIFINKLLKEYKNKFNINKI